MDKWKSEMKNLSSPSHANIPQQCSTINIMLLNGITLVPMVWGSMVQVEESPKQSGTFITTAQYIIQVSDYNDSTDDDDSIR